MVHGFSARPFPVRLGTASNVSENLWDRGPCRLTLPAGAPAVLGIGSLTPLPSGCHLPVPTGRFICLGWVYDPGVVGKLGWLDCTRMRILNGRRGSSDDHPLLVTARDVPARASQKPYGTREEGLMRARLAGILGEWAPAGRGEGRGGRRGALMPRGCRPVACDPGGVDLHGLRRSDPIWDEKDGLSLYGSTGRRMVHTCWY